MPAWVNSPQHWWSLHLWTPLTQTFLRVLKESLPCSPKISWSGLQLLCVCSLALLVELSFRHTFHRHAIWEVINPKHQIVLFSIRNAFQLALVGYIHMAHISSVRFVIDEYPGIWLASKNSLFSIPIYLGLWQMAGLEMYCVGNMCPVPGTRSLWLVGRPKFWNYETRI